MSDKISLKSRLADKTILVAPGIYDGLSALMAEQAGAEAVYLSGASIAYTRFGRPDLGLVGMSEVAETLALIRDRIALPIIVDADNGYGNALNVQRCVRMFERAGANAIQLEDQVFPKRCGHLDGKELVSTSEMTGKIKAALDARSNKDTLIIARTDANGVEGFEAAMVRAEAYVQAGADMLFIEGPESEDQLRQAAKHFGGKIPLMANMVEGGKTPLMSAQALEAMGYGLVIFPGGLVRAQTLTTKRYFESLLAHGTNEPFLDNLIDFTGVNNIIGTSELLDEGRKYQPDETEEK